MLNKIPETKSSIIPTVKNTIDIKEKGTEKYPDSLNIVKVITEEIIPIISIINPGIPKKVIGLFIKTSSSKEIKTLLPCLTGF